MAGSLSSVDLKLNRASQHLEELSRLAHIDHHRYVTPRTVPLDDRTFEFYLEPPPLPVEDLSAVLGDFLFNLRASLDHLVYQLHVRQFAGRVPERVEGNSAFPVRVIEPKEPPGSWREIRSLPSSEQEEIARLQPYLLDPASPSFSDKEDGDDDIYWRRVALRDVSQLNNVDKHRRLNLVSVAMQGVVVESGDFGEERRSGHPIRSTEWVIRRTYTEPQSDPPLHPGIVIDVGLESQDGLYPMLVPWMQMLRRVVGEIVDGYRPRFDGAAFGDAASPL